MHYDDFLILDVVTYKLGVSAVLESELNFGQVFFL
jgi:hypothetical protein